MDPIDLLKEDYPRRRQQIDSEVELLRARDGFVDSLDAAQLLRNLFETEEARPLKLRGFDRKLPKGRPNRRKSTRG